MRVEPAAGAAKRKAARDNPGGLFVTSSPTSPSTSPWLSPWDSNPTKLLEVVEVGKQLLMTRGCLTTFSIANDVAKYFAILPAMFMVVFPEIAPLNVMGLASPLSAILSAVIFNAIIIILLIPLALRGVQYRPLGAAALLRRSLLIYGVGGVVAPFVGIKLIDMALAAVGLV